jgi:pimeloyl-ACP methyl ester carboxylesterase
VPVTGDDSIALLHLPNPAAHFTILYSHGNAEDLGDVRPILEALHGYGFAVVAYDYRGYGRSSGSRPTARRATADAEAAYGFTVRSLGVAPGRLILLGRSVGSGPAVHLAVRYQVAGLILESAFTSPYRVLTRVGILPFERFPNLARMPGIRCPVLVIHGTRDEVIPFAHGRALLAAATSRTQSFGVEGAGHNDLLQVAGPRYREALQLFARSITE